MNSNVNGCGLCKVTIDNVSVRRGRDCLLSGITFELRCGELAALIGVNGAGKTTLLKAILGEIRHEGSVTFSSHDGKLLSDITVGYVPQNLDFDRYAPVSVRDFLLAGRTQAPVCFYRSKKLEETVDDSLRRVSCEQLKNRRLGELSGGELQRVMLVAALRPMPELLILDEPVSGVDLSGSEAFYEAISDLRKHCHVAIVMVTHDLEVVRKYADKVLLLNKKVLRMGNADEVFASKEFQDCFFMGVTGGDSL